MCAVSVCVVSRLDECFMCAYACHVWVCVSGFVSCLSVCILCLDVYGVSLCVCVVAVCVMSG